MTARPPDITHELAELDAIFRAQRIAFLDSPNPSANERCVHLKALYRLLVENIDAIAAAIDADFGHRSVHETKLLELFPSIQAVNHARRHVKKWMRPERRTASKWFFPGRARLVKQPLGVVGIIVPWNYPLYLAIGPLVSAIAAGNRAMVKISELTPRFGHLLKELMGKYFRTDEIAVVNGGVEMAQAFASVAFDHLLFTGSGAVGRRVMRAAAENLTPVTLELGGKSPAIIAPDFPIDLAARRIMFGKCLNSGQTCVAPDYVLLHESQLASFIRAAKDEVRLLYPGISENADYSAIINDRHYDRLQSYLEDALAKGAEVILLGEDSKPALRRLAPAIVTKVDDGMQIMQDEIFGPLLPILTYRDLGEALSYVADHPHPLALYYFDYNKARIENLLQKTIAGGVTINDTICHLAQDELPFGGVGASGMGHYHGSEGFNTMSKRKGVFIQSRFNGIPFLKPPFGKRIDQILKFMLR